MQTASVNRSRSGFVLEDGGKWNICYCKCSLKRAACCSATLWLSEPVGLFVTSPRFVDALWLFSSRCPSSLFCLPPSHFSSLLVVFDVRCLAAAVCHVVLLGQALLLFLLRASFSPSRVSVRPSLFAAWYLCPPCYDSSLWFFFFFLTTSNLSCPWHSLVPVSLDTLRWAFHYPLAPFSIFTPLPALFDLILLLSGICFFLHRATEVFFISDGFISTKHTGRAACAASYFFVSQFRGNYLVSVAHTM